MMGKMWTADHLRVSFAAALASGALMWGLVAPASAQWQIDWRKLEARLPHSVAVDPNSTDFGYRFEIMGYPTAVPEEFLTGGAAAKAALRRALVAGRVDSLVALVLLAQLKDHQAAETLRAILTTPQRLHSYLPATQAAIPLVLRYHLPDAEWPSVLITALSQSPSGADSTIIACLTRFDFPSATAAYKHAFPHVDLASQMRLTDRLMQHAPDDRVLWELFGLAARAETQMMILDRLERMISSRWPAEADSLAHLAIGDAACRVLPHASTTDTSVYRPLMRSIIGWATDKRCVIDAELRLSAEGDTGALDALKYRFHESDPDIRVVTGLAICRLGDRWGVGTCIRLGLRHETYRPEVIKALEKATGLAYGGDDEKWTAWLNQQRP